MTSCQPVVSTWLPSLPRDSPPRPPKPRRAFQQAASGTDGIQDLRTPQSGGDPGERPAEPRSQRRSPGHTRTESEGGNPRKRESNRRGAERQMFTRKQGHTHTHMHRHGGGQGHTHTHAHTRGGGQTTKTHFHPPTVAPRNWGPPPPATQPPSPTRSLDTTSPGRLDGQSPRPAQAYSPSVRVYKSPRRCACTWRRRSVARTHGAGL